ncbi:hypothetical protein [Flavobacterium sp. 3HN19-14]|uniref:hypothetical protein n=1 Tax=Flavobacterium sp. 3HN19-14 TaxID=3448133 RepID=UPI003EE1BD64
MIVFNNASVLNINSGSIAMKSVKVFDMRGRFIYEKNDINATATALKDLRAEQRGAFSSDHF